MDEGKGQGVVESGLRGQAEAHLIPVALARRAYLHIGGQHRIGGRDRGANSSANASGNPRPIIEEQRLDAGCFHEAIPEKNGG